ncbi:MAG: 50S ribosomal protein L15 [Anaerolineaceae bacterium 4572_78]|nr:MAG: 50S ribosomal protein L15 [Anaerolineaceae bacterium 4572_78]
MKLHDLRPAPNSKKKRKRVGRGHATGQGKTCGRGTKGQGSRSGGGKGHYFEGGQLPIVRRLPFVRGVGFTNIWRVPLKPVNVGRLADYFSDGDEVSAETLAKAGIIKKSTERVAILGDGELDKSLSIKAHRISKSAKVKIEAAGGTYEVLPKPPRKVIGRRYRK